MLIMMTTGKLETWESPCHEPVSRHTETPCRRQQPDKGCKVGGQRNP